MKLALLGVDTQMLEFVRAVVRQGEHQIVWATELGPAAGEIRKLAPMAEVANHWEVLLGSGVADVVVVARGDDDALRIDQLRKLIQAQIPLLIAQPIFDSSLDYYELEMIRQEFPCPLLPYLPARWHPAFASLADRVRSGDDPSIGTLEQMVIDRQTANRDEATVKALFIRDCDLASALCGDLTRVSAMASGGENPFANLGVQLSSSTDILVRWSVSAVEQRAGAQLTLLGSKGKAILSLPDDGPVWELTLIGPSGSETTSFEEFNAAGVSFDAMRRMIGGEEVHPDWRDATRGAELGEALGRSLARGRTIELRQDDQSEEGTFKSLMTALGCSVLVGAFFVIVAASAFTGMGIGGLLRFWPHVLLGLLFVFLLMQFLKFIIVPEQHLDHRANESDPQGSPAEDERQEPPIA